MKMVLLTIQEDSLDICSSQKIFLMIFKEDPSVIGTMLLGLYSTEMHSNSTFISPDTLHKLSLLTFRFCGFLYRKSTQTLFKDVDLTVQMQIARINSDRIHSNPIAKYRNRKYVRPIRIQFALKPPLHTAVENLVLMMSMRQWRVF